MNKKLPQSVINALSANEYVGGEGYSATTLIQPPQLVALERRYGRDEKDVLSNFKSMLGTACHNFLERYAEDDAIIEQRISADVEGVKISGQVDHYNDGVITDYKFTSAWKFVNGDFSEWEKQLNVYAWLFENGYVGDIKAGVSVHKIQVAAFFTDWSEAKALQGGGFPDAPIKVIDLPLWSAKLQYRFIQAAAQSHEDAEQLPDSELPPCTEKEMWYTGTKWAVMKKGNKRASKLCNTAEEAGEWIGKQSKGSFEVVERNGEYKRCEKYCPVASKCQQFKRIKDENSGNSS